MYLFTQLGAGAQAGKGADECALPHAGTQFFAVDMGEGVNGGVIGDRAIRNYAVGANAHVVAQRDMAFKHAVHVNFHILPADELAAYIQPCRVAQAHARSHQLMRLAALVFAFQLGQLLRAVHASHLHGVVNGVRHHGHAIGHGVFDDVGQVKLLLGVVVVQPSQPAFEQSGGRSQNAAVDFVYGQFFGCAVFLLDNALDMAAGIAQDTAITKGVVHLEREQRQSLACALRNQLLDGVGLGERHIAGKHHHHAIVCQHGCGLLHGMPRAQLGHLPHKLAPGRGVVGWCQSSFYLLGAMTRHDHDLPRLQLGGSIQHMLHQTLMRQFLQNLGHGAFHAGAFASGHDDDVERVLHRMCRARVEIQIKK